MKKIVTIIGARPQFIKASVVSRKLRESGLKEVIIHTGQHYDFNMSDVFFSELGIPAPDYHLGAGSGRHGEMTGKMLIAIEDVLLKEKPDVALVYGDTNTTIAGALAAVKLHIPVAHVEAGLRSFNRSMPEEINRVVTDHVSSLLFCPTITAVDNLRKEGFCNIGNNGELIHESDTIPLLSNNCAQVYNVGDVMFDVALSVKEKIGRKQDDILKKHGLNPEDFILVTIHRADNTDNETRLRNIWDALCALASDNKKLFFPVHPRTKKYLLQYKLLENIPKNLIISEPVSYTEMIVLESNARIVITDSGGVQKESYFFKKPAIIPREETEWVELVEAGWNVLTGADTARIVNSISSVFNGIHCAWQPFYGEGNASGRMPAIISGIL